MLNIWSSSWLSSSLSGVAICFSLLVVLLPSCARSGASGHRVLHVVTLRCAFAFPGRLPGLATYRRLEGAQADRYARRISMAYKGVRVPGWPARSRDLVIGRCLVRV